jgi:catechol 2,3-dioxygenase-like lactoylglutathione lyase family enzyme
MLPAIAVEIRHAGVVVSDLKRSLDFYCGVLGFRTVSVADEPPSYIASLLAIRNGRVTIAKLAASTGETLIELLDFHREPRQNPPLCEVDSIGPTHIALTVADLDRAFFVLRERGAQFLAAPILSPDGLHKVAFCRDPDGTLLELVERLTE